MIPIAPCKDCDKRHLKCHSTCDAYIQFKDERRAFNKALQTDREIKAYTQTVLTKSFQLKNKKKNWRRKGEE